MLAVAFGLVEENSPSAIDFHVNCGLQTQRLMSETEPLWLKTIIIVATMTAFREGELFALHWGNVDFKRWTIKVDGTVVEDENYVPVVGPPKAKASLREIVLPAYATEL